MQLPNLAGLISIISFGAGAVQAAVNGPCSAHGTPGVCVSTMACTRAGGKSFREPFCPDDPEDIQCCTKTVCGNNGGNCRWTSQCSGIALPDNLCPGPDGFRCCEAGSNIPNIPSYNCKTHVIENGKFILNQFPGEIHTVWCYANKAGDHGLGLALDLMHKNRDPIGQEIGVWVMNNAGRLRVKYVISGQKIWEEGIENPKPWSEWTQMEDRGDDTQNHWDHVHVSFYA